MTISGWSESIVFTIWPTRLGGMSGAWTCTSEKKTMDTDCRKFGTFTVNRRTIGGATAFVHPTATNAITPINAAASKQVRTMGRRIGAPPAVSCVCSAGLAGSTLPATEKVEIPRERGSNPLPYIMRRRVAEIILRP